MNEVVYDTVVDSVRVKKVDVQVYKIATDTPEADGTLKWNSTTIIIVSIEAGGQTGIGYTYAHETIGSFINTRLKEIITGKNAFDIPGINRLMMQQVRNSGTCGMSMMAISAVDNALWDLKAKLLNSPLCCLLGQAKQSMLLYGSGGFTSYSNKQLQTQFENWANQGIQYLKMKIGSAPDADLARVAAAREAVNKKAKLMVDANGAFTIKQALQIAGQIEQYNVVWFEEPVSSDNLTGLNFIKEHAPVGMNIAAGEYGYNLPYFHAMLQNNAVDVLQADATRCGGITGFLKAGILAEAEDIPFSSHCAPALHLHAALSLPSFFIAEYFHDHARIEQMFFDGFVQPVNGELKPDLSTPGLGLELKAADVEKYKI